MTNNPREFGQTAPSGGEQDPWQPCTRHPDRLTAVHCQRCERPMCPDCSRSAAVGMQCVDCVVNAANSARLGMNKSQRFWGNSGSSWSNNSGNSRGSLLSGIGNGILVGAPATAAIFVICVVVYLLQFVLPLTSYGAYQVVAAYSQPWRFITAGFLHGSFMHLAMNMMVLVLVGASVERALGTTRYVVLYLLSVVGGGVGYVLWSLVESSAVYEVSLGASGAGFGLFAAVYILQRRFGANMTSITVLLLVNIVFSFTVPGIAWQAHLGGLATGALVTAGYAASAQYALKTRQKIFQAQGAAKAQHVGHTRRIISDSAVSIGVLILLFAACVPVYGISWPLAVLGLAS